MSRTYLDQQCEMCYKRNSKKVYFSSSIEQTLLAEALNNAEHLACTFSTHLDTYFKEGPIEENLESHTCDFGRMLGCQLVDLMSSRYDSYGINVRHG
ncbi:hypothetical protein NPIL_120001 [Nephila pilipes]|uniref:Uncharacterized protein n=1 Tax=Nephila pilipes TaxID=299642 RepID=A0A8X6UFS2_NEPPI|nr:hypothetical protein NPIL_120001 [Nephila pilipes]